ncbi:MAG TPA: ABC transporter ATP-binding protein, partial [Burkholderiales bacterium]|nr:ABC transporter ATP-binding protein [Burkholderiales bacterium]
EDLTAFENLRFYAGLYGVPAEKRRARLEEVLARTGLDARRDQIAGTLSGGWKQRLALAACMLHDPKLLLLDEPTAGVDPKARREFWEEIHALAARGISVLVSTHYMDEAERCHRLVYIAYGKLLATGTPDQILRERPLAAWTVSGPDLAALSAQLRALPGVAQVTAFGNTLHVTGDDAAALEAAIAPLRSQPGLTWQRAEAGLEDVFIDLMRDAQEAP